MLPRDRPPALTSGLLDSPPRTFARREMASDGDITRPHNPIPRMAMSSEAQQHWHVQLELRPEQLVALHRMGYTSGALAWREGMDRWQPLRDGQGAEAEALTEADLEDDAEERERSGTQARDDGEATNAHHESRRGFVFPRGRAPGTSLPPPPVSTRPPPPHEDHVLDEMFARPLPPPPRIPGSVPPRGSNEVLYEPPLHDAPEAEAHYTPGPLALLPKPSWLTQTHQTPVALERPISIPPPAVLDMYRGAQTLLRPRTLWLGMSATVLLSAAVAALVSSLVWNLQSRFADTRASSVDKPPAASAVEAVKSEGTAASAPAEPQPTSVSVDQLPLLSGTRTAAPVTITTPEPERREPERRELERREPDRAANVDEGSNRSLNRAAFLGLPHGARGAAPSAKQASSAIEEQIAERVAREAEPAKHAEPSEPSSPAEPSGPADRDAVARAVGQAAQAARSCGTSPETGQVLVKFAPSGSAQSIQLLKPFSNRDVNACVLRAMSRARVAPFTGEPVSVKKSVRW